MPEHSAAECAQRLLDHDRAHTEFGWKLPLTVADCRPQTRSAYESNGAAAAAADGDEAAARAMYEESLTRTSLTPRPWDHVWPATRDFWRRRARIARGVDEPSRKPVAAAAAPARDEHVQEAFDL